MKLRARHLIWLSIGIAATIGIGRAFLPTPVVVDVATVRQDTLVVTVEDDGRTRVRERYTVHAPIQGRLLRTALDPGDAVRAADTAVAEFEPIVPSLLDERSRAEAEARLARTRATIDETRARLEQARAEAAYADSRLTRVTELVKRGIESPDSRELAERDARARREAERAAEFALRVAEFEAEVAAAAMHEPVGDGHAETSQPDPPRRLSLRAPIDGVVLRVFEESSRPLAAGAAIVEVGDVRSIEVVADFLSQDAVRVRAGMPARIVGWGGETVDGEPLVLAARVRVVEPSGFTKISALGVEEQRVDIVLDPDGDVDRWAPLGDGYRVDVRIETWRGDDLRIVPTGALFRDGERHAVFLFDTDERAALRHVRIGRRTGIGAEVLEGVEVGDRVVMYPSAMVIDGAPLQAR